MRCRIEYGEGIKQLLRYSHSTCDLCNLCSAGAVSTCLLYSDYVSYHKGALMLYAWKWIRIYDTVQTAVRLLEVLVYTLYSFFMIVMPESNSYHVPGTYYSCNFVCVFVLCRFSMPLESNSFIRRCLPLLLLLLLQSSRNVGFWMWGKFLNCSTTRACNPKAPALLYVKFGWRRFGGKPCLWYIAGIRDPTYSIIVHLHCCAVCIVWYNSTTEQL